jgi:hypothetical protein
LLFVLKQVEKLFFDVDKINYNLLKRYWTFHDLYVYIKITKKTIIVGIMWGYIINKKP